MTPLWPPEVEKRLREAAYNADQQKPPSNVRMCTRCVMTNQRPRIVFDEEGVCSACRYAERKWQRGIDWIERGKELDRLLSLYRNRAPYDVIVPCSGGKDSVKVAWEMKHTHKMHPLCVTWAPFIYTDIGWRNFQNFVQSGFDVMSCYPNGIMHRKLARLSLEFFGDPFIPFIFGQLCWPMNMAVRMGIRLVFFGENGDLEYGGDPSAENKHSWGYDDWARVYQKGASVDWLIRAGLELHCFTLEEANSLSPFYRLPENIADKAEFHWYGYYAPWHPMENFYLASEKTGFETNDERSEGTYTKFASLDDRLDCLHYYFGFLKFGIGRCTSDAAQQVRNGDITRDEALALIKRYDGEFPEKHLNECLDYLGMTREHLDTVAARFSNSASSPVLT